MTPGAKVDEYVICFESAYVPEQLLLLRSVDALGVERGEGAGYQFQIRDAALRNDVAEGDLPFEEVGQRVPEPVHPQEGVEIGRAQISVEKDGSPPLMSQMRTHAADDEALPGTPLASANSPDFTMFFRIVHSPLGSMFSQIFQ